MASNHLSAPKQTFSLIVLVLTLALCAVAYWLTHWSLYLLWMLAITLTTFVFYGFDKRQAGGGAGRVPEIVLHGASLAGGFLGGWLGRLVFRHKTQKPVFTVVLIVATVLHCVLFYVLAIRKTL